METSTSESREALLSLAATTAERDVSSNPYLTAQRWRSYLLEHSVAFRRLQKERERGWRSVALDQWYAERKSNTPTSSTDAVVTDPPRPSSHRTAQQEAPQGKGTSVFGRADVSVLAERYRQHARRITQRAASSFFTAVPRRTSSGNNSPDGHSELSAPLFLDLGCAPGGVSKYLVKDLGWRGVGVTLARVDGGIDMDPALLEECTRGDASFLLLDGDVTQPPSTWKRSASCALVECETSATRIQETALSAPPSTASSTGVSSPSTSLFKLVSAGEPRFHFVNGGAVLDHGQRQRWDRTEEATVAITSPSSGGVTPEVGGRCGADCNDVPHSGSSLSTRVQVEAFILPWFSLLVPQLRTALACVAAGGALMMVHGFPYCASLFILMRCMEEVVGVAGAPPTSAARGNVHVLETMHLTKTPVYVLWTGVRLPRNYESHVVDDQAMENAQKCLLEALSTTSPRISPLCGNTPSPPAGTSTSDSQALLLEKQRLWLGESDEGFQLSVDGFQRYGHLVEAVWERAEAFLRQRRELAESKVCRGDNSPRRTWGAGTAKNPKRVRREG